MAERVAVGVDAGGTATRAVAVDAAGAVLGTGRAGGGNPTSRGAAVAAAAVVEAVLLAADGRSGDVAQVLVAHAGERLPEYYDGIRSGLAAAGVVAPLDDAGDLLALFASGTPALAGSALIAGTGAIGGAVADGRLVRVVDGTGWLLGDAGSGFWIGHRVARAVVDDLDGGAPTALTAPLLAALELPEDRTDDEGRAASLRVLVGRLYAMPPVQLSVFAPLAFRVPDDPVAAAIVQEAVAALAALLRRVRAGRPDDAALVFGGSVLAQGVLRLPDSLRAPLDEAAGGATPVVVSDGLVGAAVLALRSLGRPVSPAVFERLRTALAPSA